MEYSDALAYIHGTLKFGSKLGLHNVSRLLELMGNPQDKLKFVHLAGTNGKGSTAAFISSILEKSGYRTGLYTSPFLQRFTERIRVDGQEISPDDLARITAFVREKVEVMLEKGENHPTEFEIVTAMAFQYYLETNCDFVVLEVGLGGRFDSTNVIKTPELAVITTISYDHMDRLGNTLPEIAFEKAGIIKPGGDVLIYPQLPVVEKVFTNACDERGARLNKADFSQLRLNSFNVDGQAFNYKDLKNIKITLMGGHQIRNAALAIDAARLLASKGCNISEASIRAGLSAAKWPGRLEVLSKKPLFLIDGAHNQECAEVLRDTLDLYFPEKRRIFIVGVLKDKDYKAMVNTVLPGSSMVITVTPESDRALPAGELAMVVQDYCKNVLISDTIEKAVKTVVKEASENDVVCAFGSLYYIGAVRTAFGL